MDLPDDDALRWVVRSYARFRAAHGEAIGAPALVQPTADYFPDEFRRDGPSIVRFLRRMIAHSPVSDEVALELVVLDGGERAGCGSPGCDSAGPAALRAVEELDGGYRLFIAAEHLGHSDLLAASLARNVGALALLEAGDANPSAVEAEIVAVACGFGVLLANGAAAWSKGCGGLRMASATALSLEEVSIALALFVAVHAVPTSSARAHLPPTQREALGTALEWADSNRWLVEALRDRPATLVDRDFPLEPIRGAFSRWLRDRAHARAARPLPASTRPSVSEERRRRLEEVRAMVDEALGEE